MEEYAALQAFWEVLSIWIVENNIKPEISRVFYNLEDIGKAHTLMESNMAQGKIIFKLE